MGWGLSQRERTEAKAGRIRDERAGMAVEQAACVEPSEAELEQGRKALEEKCITGE